MKKSTPLLFIFALMFLLNAHLVSAATASIDTTVKSFATNLNNDSFLRPWIIPSPSSVSDTTMNSSILNFFYKNGFYSIVPSKTAKVSDTTAIAAIKAFQTATGNITPSGIIIQKDIITAKTISDNIQNAVKVLPAGIDSVGIAYPDGSISMFNPINGNFTAPKTASDLESVANKTGNTPTDPSIVNWHIICCIFDGCVRCHGGQWWAF